MEEIEKMKLDGEIHCSGSELLELTLRRNDEEKEQMEMYKLMAISGTLN